MAARLRLWQATSAERDFRAAQWRPAVISQRSSDRFELARPATGYVAVFGEAAFGRGLSAFVLSTNLAVVAAAGEPYYGTEPRGSAGVCAGLERRPPLPVP